MTDTTSHIKKIQATDERLEQVSRKLAIEFHHRLRSAEVEEMLRHHICQIESCTWEEVTFEKVENWKSMLNHRVLNRLHDKISPPITPG